MSPTGRLPCVLVTHRLSPWSTKSGRGADPGVPGRSGWVPVKVGHPAASRNCLSRGHVCRGLATGPSDALVGRLLALAWRLALVRAAMPT
jgi:hypothetical protein